MVAEVNDGSPRTCVEHFASDLLSGAIDRPIHFAAVKHRPLGAVASQQRFALADWHLLLLELLSQGDELGFKLLLASAGQHPGVEGVALDHPLLAEAFDGIGKLTKERWQFAPHLPRDIRLPHRGPELIAGERCSSEYSRKQEHHGSTKPRNHSASNGLTGQSTWRVGPE